MPGIARPSVASLLLFLESEGRVLGTATGFLVERDGTTYLITNFHVLAGRRPDDRTVISPDGACPDTVRILHNASGRLGTWIPKRELLHMEDGLPAWYQHPTHGPNVDVVALPLDETDGIDVHGYDPWSPVTAAVPMAGSLSIVGFPFGSTYGGAMATWVQGFVASEREIDYGELPRFLVDARTRPGQSGSPVIFYSGGAPFTDNRGTLHVGGQVVEELIGVYSGRINADSDLGFVWRQEVIREIIEGETLGIN